LLLKKKQKNRITGWIKYISEGTTEVMETGTEKQLQQFIGWCHKGPENAVVADVIVTPLSEQSFYEFTVIQGTYPHDI